MNTIYRYQPASDAYTAYHLLPPLRDGALVGQRIADLDGYIYWSIPDDAELPPQHLQITVKPVTLTDELRDALCAISPAVQLIRRQVVEKIRSAYSIEDEIKALRLAPSAETTAWNAHVEDCRDWGRERKAELGL